MPWLPDRHEKHFIEEIQFSYTNLNNLNLTFTKPWIRSALSVFQAQPTHIWEKHQMLMFLLFVEWAHWPKVQKTINSNTLAKIVAESEIFASSILDKHQLLSPACCGMPTAHCIVNGQNWPQYFLDNPGGRWCTHHPHLLIQRLVWCWQAGHWCHTSSCGWRRVPRHDNSDVF